MNSKDYHDYVIKDGKLIGEFEEMYKNSDTIPWHQDEQKYWMDVLLTKQLFLNKTYDELYDFGAGLGYYLDILNSFLGTENTTCIGYDISSTACINAKKKFPKYDFFKLDLMSNKHNITKQINNDKTRLFSIRGTLWYVFPKLKLVVKNIASLMNENEELLIIQNFPPLENNFVGKEVLPNYEAIENAFSPYFIPIKKIWYQNNELLSNDNWYIGIFKRNEKLEN